MNMQRLQRTLTTINRFGASGKGITRLAYTNAYRDAMDYFISLCKEEGLAVRVDACGNMIARREGQDSRLPVVACGSHLDTVIQGGGYDGTLGVMVALEVIRQINEERITTKHPIEIIAFACEESTRFGVSTLGSKAMAGSVNKDIVSKLYDKNGISIQEAFRDFSLDFEAIGDAARHPDECKLFLELHIEQGPVLELEHKQVGIVKGIAAPTRLHVYVEGKASHSGTTPMNRRKDALTAAAEIILEVERAAGAEATYGTVGTVGVCEVQPGAVNVIPGAVTLQIDIRGTYIDSKQSVIRQLYHLFGKLEEQRGVTVTCEIIHDETPVLLHEEVAEHLSKTCEQMGISYLQMVSGAGHDAMNMVKLCPTGLIFIPCRDGLSHHPEEFASVRDIEVGMRLLKQALLDAAIPVN